MTGDSCGHRCIVQWKDVCVHIYSGSSPLTSTDCCSSRKNISAFISFSEKIPVQVRTTVFSVFAVSECHNGYRLLIIVIFAVLLLNPLRVKKPQLS